MCIMQYVHVHYAMFVQNVHVHYGNMFMCHDVCALCQYIHNIICTIACAVLVQYANVCVLAHAVRICIAE